MDKIEGTEQPSTQIIAFEKFTLWEKYTASMFVDDSTGITPQMPSTGTTTQLKNAIEDEFGPDVFNDDTITRFLIARDYDVKQAYSMLKKHLEWRKKNKVDTIIQDYHVTEVFEKYMPLSMVGFGNENNPVLVSSYGRLDHKGLAKAITKEEYLRYLVYFYEIVKRRTKEHSNKVEGTERDKQMIVIADTEDFSLMQFSSSAIERAIEVCLMNDANYPEKLKTLYVVNASTTFQFLYRILKPYMTRKTLEKIKVYGKDGWKEELLKIIDPQVLPAYLGGERTDPDGNPMCPSIICHGGHVPERFYIKNFGKSHLKYEPGVKSLLLKRQSKFDLPLEIEVEGALIEWTIETDYYDVGFGLSYKEFNSSGDADELVLLIPKQRLNSSHLREDGTFKCQKPGVYILTLDNSYSFFRSKTVYYKISVVKPGEVKHDVS